jgi:hypothetical protein
VSLMGMTSENLEGELPKNIAKVRRRHRVSMRLVVSMIRSGIS